MTTKVCIINLGPKRVRIKKLAQVGEIEGVPHSRASVVRELNAGEPLSDLHVFDGQKIVVEEIT